MPTTQLILGDCLEKMLLIPEGSIDMVLCDPPYNITNSHWDTKIPFEAMWEQLLRVTHQHSAIVLMASQPFSSQLIMSNLKMFKYNWVWKKNQKTNFLNAKRQPLRQTEDIVVFYTKQPTYNPQKTSGHSPVNSYTKHKGDGETLGKTRQGFSGGGQTDRHPTNIIKIPVVNNDNSTGDKTHPAQKPVKLMEYLIKTYTNKNDRVLDFTMGSGTTGVACVNLGRSFTGIELSEKYFKTAVERIKPCL